MSAFHVIPQGAHFIEASAALQTNEVLLRQASLPAQLDLLDRPEPVELPEHHDVVVHLRLPPPVVLVLAMLDECGHHNELDDDY